MPAFSVAVALRQRRGPMPSGLARGRRLQNAPRGRRGFAPSQRTNSRKSLTNNRRVSLSLARFLLSRTLRKCLIVNDLRGGPAQVLDNQRLTTEASIPRRARFVNNFRKHFPCQPCALSRKKNRAISENKPCAARVSPLYLQHEN